MKKLIAILMLAVAVNSLTAEESPLSMGYILSEKAGNFGIGLEVSSPSIFDGFLSIRLESQLEWLSSQMFVSNSDLSWEMYSSHKLGIVGTGGFAGDIIKLYGEFGGLCVLPNTGVSADEYQLGIYGLFGFEFFMEKNSFISYFIECGTTGLFAGADKLTDNPDYLSGWSTFTGIRLYF